MKLNSNIVFKLKELRKSSNSKEVEEMTTLERLCHVIPVINCENFTMGFASYNDENSVKLTIPSGEVNPSRSIIINEDITDKFLELPKNMYKIKEPYSFVIDTVNGDIGTVTNTHDKQINTVNIVWENRSSSVIRYDLIDWKTDLIGVLNIEEYLQKELDILFKEKNLNGG